jgi:hypothetical protein
LLKIYLETAPGVVAPAVGAVPPDSAPDPSTTAGLAQASVPSVFVEDAATSPSAKATKEKERAISIKMYFINSP